MLKPVFSTQIYVEIQHWNKCRQESGRTFRSKAIIEFNVDKKDLEPFLSTFVDIKLNISFRPNILTIMSTLGSMLAVDIILFDSIHNLNILPIDFKVYCIFERKKSSNVQLRKFVLEKKYVFFLFRIFRVQIFSMVKFVTSCQTQNQLSQKSPTHIIHIVKNSELSSCKINVYVSFIKISGRQYKST